jgi:carbonic anhydrase
MPTRKNTKTKARRSGARKAGARSAGDVRSGARTAGDVLRETWEAALASLSAAEAELEKQVRAVMSGKGIGADAAGTLRQLGQRLEKERRKVARDIESRVSSLQARMKRERKSLAGVVDDTVRGALAALNIPSLQEIGDLTRKVDELSRKIDGFPARPARRTPVRKARTAASA